MFLTNTEVIPGKTITICHGVVSGSTVRAKHVGRDLMAGLKNIFGGELKGYTELLQEAREEVVYIESNIDILEQHIADLESGRFDDDPRFGNKHTDYLQKKILQYVKNLIRQVELSVNNAPDL